MRWLFVLFALLAAALPARAAPLAAYGKLPSIEAAALSPSGKALTIVVTDGEKRSIVVKDLASGKFTHKGASGDVKVRSVMWAGDDHLVVVTSVTAAPMYIQNARREWLMAFVFDLRSGKVRALMNDAEGAAHADAMNAIFGMPVVRTVKGEPVVFLEGVQFKNGEGLLSLFRVDLNTGRSRLIESGFADTRDWVVGPEGQPVAQELYDGATGRWSVKVRDGHVWRDAYSVVAKLDPPNLIGLGKDGASVLFDVGSAWRQVRLDGGAAAELPPPSKEQLPIYDPQTGRLIGHFVLLGDEDRYTFFDPEDARVWRAVLKAYPGERVALESASADRRRIVVKVDSATDGPAFALVDLATRKAEWLGAEYAALKPGDIALKEPVRFKAQDGLELTGYLTRPRSAPAKNLPLIVLPHGGPYGGPTARDMPGFDWWAQAMASRGYAVLQVNFRGSDGLGRALLSAGYGEWGRKMQTDLSDGVRHLASQGVIDPKRVCIVGASYGGYAALAGATLDRGVYRCAVSVAGVADLRRQVTYARTRGGLPHERYWHRFIGAESRGDAIFTDYSPAAQAAKADIPILLIHGKDDTVVPLEQSRVMAGALAKAGKPHELLVIKGEDNWLSRGETRLQMLTATMAFVEKHNPPN